MLDEGRIAVLLDGLDEIPEDLRPTVLRALSQQATFRLVLLTRSAEMAGAAARATLQGAAAIELQDIGPGAAVSYLTRTQLDPPPHGWQELTRRLRREPGGPLAQALNNPLMLTLVRDTYRATDDVAELLGLRDAAGQPASSEDIAGHLLDRVLPAAYTPQPGQPPPRYDLPTAERALRRIATRMNNDGTRDLHWWRVPAWAHAAPRVIATWLGAGLVGGLVTGLARLALPEARSWNALLPFALEYGTVAAIVAGIALGRGDKIPKRRAPVRWRQLFRRRPLAVGLLTGIVAGTGVVWLLAALVEGHGVVLFPLKIWLPTGLAAGLVAWLGAGLVAGMSQPGTDIASPLSPVSSWRSDRAFGLVAGLVVGLGLATWLVAEIAGLVWQVGSLGDVLLPLVVVEPVIGLAIGLLAGLVYPQAWSSSLAFAQLTASDRTPVRLMRFLEDARSRSVLRTVGPVYQFRHGRLQDRLAAQRPAAGQGPGAPAVEAPPASGQIAAKARPLPSPRRVALGLVSHQRLGAHLRVETGRNRGRSGSGVRSLSRAGESGIPAGEVAGEVVGEDAGADLQAEASRELPSSAWAKLKGRLVGVAAVAVPRVVARGRGPRVALGWRWLGLGRRRGRPGKGRGVGLVLQGGVP